MRGESVSDWNHGAYKLIRKLAGKEEVCFDKAISIGCGLAHKEMDMLKSGLVNRFVCFDLAEKF